MNTSSAPVRSPDSDRLLHTTATADDHATLTFVDRLELRLGLWLLLRSARRVDDAHDRGERRRRVSSARSRADLEHAALRAHALGTVRT